MCEATKSKNRRRRKSRSKSKITPPAAPVDNAGKWVETQNFQGSKSFGFFKCRQCRQKWISAHAFKVYKQGCKRCNSTKLPDFMWQNDKRTPSDRAEKESKAPHDKGRCGACLLGLKICLE
jgi:hypothetical protein